MDFSKSLSIGENTFQEIDDCETKLDREIKQVCDAKHSLICSNTTAAGYADEIENSAQNYIEKCTNANSEKHRRNTSDLSANKTFKKSSLTVEKPDAQERCDIRILEMHKVGSDIICSGKNNGPVSIEIEKGDIFT